MAKILSPSNEDYLEAIYDLSKEHTPVRSIDVSTRLGVSRASVNKAVGLLKDSGLLTQEPYGAITLTGDGMQIASRVRQCHTTIRTFLQHFLHVPDDTAEEEACKIEHAISDDTLDRLALFVKETSRADSKKPNPLPEGFGLREVTDANQKSEICARILKDLRSWFEIDAAVEAYIQSVRSLPFWYAYAVPVGGGAPAPAGFAALQRLSGASAEIHVMGVLSEYHRKGLGRALIDSCIEYCRSNGLRFLTVKTLDESHPDEGYARTRAFYRSVGFLPLETSTAVWGADNPCLTMAMHIAPLPIPSGLSEQSQ